MEKILSGRVVKVLDEYKLVINKGTQDGVVSSDRFLIYQLGEELIDPDTNESLGILEIVCGEGRPEHIQEHITTIVSTKQKKTKSKTVIRRSGIAALYGGEVEETYDPELTLLPFEGLNEHCLFKKIN